MGSTEPEKKFAHQTYHVVILTEQVVWFKENLEKLTRENEEVRKERDRGRVNRSGRHRRRRRHR